MGYDLDILIKNIRTIREDHGLSAYKLGKLINWQHSTIHNYETGRNIPKMDFVIDFCNYFKVNVDDLLKKEL